MTPSSDVLEARRIDEDLATALGTLPVALAILRGPELVHMIATPAYRRLVAHDDLVIAKAVECVYRTGKAFVDHELAIVGAGDSGGSPHRRYFDIAVHPLIDVYGCIEGVTVVAFDVTAHVDRRLASDARCTEADQRDRAKDDFLAVASHELRNPLMAILGWTRFLRTEVTTNLQTERSLERIERNAITQSKLIDDLLDIPRITRGKLELEVRELELDELVAGVVESSRPAMADKALRVELTCDGELPRIAGDGPRLQQVVWNLITNAAKFTRRGGRIAIELRRDADDLVLCVADDGDGIPPEMLETIFERFKQVDSGSAGTRRGLGLGLWIARDIVALHGGTLRAYSDGPGRGAMFVMHLPIDRRTCGWAPLPSR
jgi:signal transduction histidine kinase